MLENVLFYDILTNHGRNYEKMAVNYFERTKEVFKWLRKKIKK